MGGDGWEALLSGDATAAWLPQIAWPMTARSKWGNILNRFGKIAAGVVLSLGVSTLAMGAAQAAGVLDQSNTGPAAGLNGTLEWEQQVTAGTSGVLTGITLFGGATSLLVRIATGDGPSVGPYQFSETTALDGAALGTFIDTSAANINLTSGEHFVIDVSQGSAEYVGTGHAYHGGDVFVISNGSPIDETAANGLDFAFQTFVGAGGETANDGGGQPIGVPEPASWALMIAGFGLAGATLRVKRRLLA
jgi:hypothetical protein